LQHVNNYFYKDITNIISDFMS